MELRRDELVACGGPAPPGSATPRVPLRYAGVRAAVKAAAGWLRTRAVGYVDAAMSDLTYVISDVHLGGVPADSEARFLDFLGHVAERADALVIAGDLFDFWFEYRSVVLREHFAALRGLADVVEAGVDVRMIGGNHDAWGGGFLEEEVGLRWLEGPAVTEICGRTTYLAHGDGLADGDWSYRVLKKIVRSRPARRAFRAVHPDLADRVVQRLTRTPERESQEPNGELERARALSDHAAELLGARRELDLVVFGHAHRPELREVEPGRHYLNPGDWIHSFSYGIVTPEGLRLEEWNGRPG